MHRIDRDKQAWPMHTSRPSTMSYETQKDKTRMNEKFMPAVFYVSLTGEREGERTDIKRAKERRNSLSSRQVKNNPIIKGRYVSTTGNSYIIIIDTTYKIWIY